MPVTIKDVEHIAELSRLILDDSQKEQMRVHLEGVLEHFKTLDSADVSNVAATAHILDSVNVLREDVPTESFEREKLLSNAPESEDGAYVVPRAVD